jgi:hypothetical protein
MYLETESLSLLTCWIKNRINYHESKINIQQLQEKMKSEIDQALDLLNNQIEETKVSNQKIQKLKETESDFKNKLEKSLTLKQQLDEKYADSKQDL